MPKFIIVLVVTPGHIPFVAPEFELDFRKFRGIFFFKKMSRNFPYEHCQLTIKKTMIHEYDYYSLYDDSDFRMINDGFDDFRMIAGIDDFRMTDGFEFYHT